MGNFREGIRNALECALSERGSNSRKGILINLTYKEGKLEVR